MPSNSTTKTPAASGHNRTRKRKRSESSSSDFETELHGDELESAKAIEKKLREIAKEKSLTPGEMRKLLARLVKNEHVLALVTLKAEDEIAKEQLIEEKPGLLIIDTPSVPKLTRSKARELQKVPGIGIPALSDDSHSDIVTLIKEDLHSDDDDEEYTFQEEDFVSDDDPNTTTSDLDSNPRTPKTSFSQNDNEESPVKFTEDGCFKVPFSTKKTNQADLLIATRTRSKFCLEQTTIEDIQSEFIPPDVDQYDASDIDFTTTDEDWMQFLNDFSKPLTSTNVADDDDPVNDPEYVAAEKVPVDAEELRDANISKRELAALIAELFEGFAEEQISQESVNLETPEMFLNNYNLSLNPSEITANNEQNLIENLPDSTVGYVQSTNTEYMQMSTPSQPQICVPDSTISNSSLNQAQPIVLSNNAIVPIAQYSTSTTTMTCNQIFLAESPVKMEPNLIAIPAPGQPNTYHLAKVIESNDVLSQSISTSLNDALQLTRTSCDTYMDKSRHDTRYSIPYDSNYTWEYISIKRHVYSEYKEKFERLRHVVVQPPSFPPELHGFTVEQHDMLQQQLRLHVQMVTQTFLQTYCHPDLWKVAPQCKNMLLELQKKSLTDNSFKVWNLNDAVDLISEWERSLSEDTIENKELMRYLHEEIGKTNRNTRQIAHFPPRIMDTILNSTVFVYPNYLPRIPFSCKQARYPCFSPAELFLIAFGLDKHMTKIQESGEQIPKKISPYRVACERLCKDTVFGKTKRRVWDHIKQLQQEDHYNPVKYYFDNDIAPPIESVLMPFNCYGVVPPIRRFDELPLAWQNYIKTKNQPQRIQRNKEPREKVLKQTTASFLELVRETVDENISPNSLKNCSANATTCRKGTKKIKKQDQPKVLTVNVNYLFGAEAIPPNAPLSTNFTINAGNNSVLNSTLTENNDVNIPAINYDILSNPSPQKHIVEHLANSAASRKSCNAKLGRKPIYSKLGANYRKITFSISRKRKLKKFVQNQKLRRYFIKLFKSYQEQLTKHKNTYLNSPLINYYYRQFKALELYTDLLVDLKLFCQNKMNATGNNTSNTSSTNKRSRSSAGPTNEDDTTTPLKSKKPNRQEENFRQMLLPDTAEDANRKDAIFALNFYEKAELTLRSSKRPEDFHKFITILKTFDPHKEKVTDLYLKLENLFLPDHVELAEIFLTFLLPSEAAAIGKFFEHFLICNMTRFINKLNVYFNKQPGQIKKIYDCLNELSEIPNVTIADVETRILPLLKGNQFLIEWFLQQFPSNRPPERLFSAPELVNLKEVQENVGEFVETIPDILESPSNEPSQGCQLRYLNGRIFYGSKITLPAKLSFMASSYQDSDCSGSNIIRPCVHGIREHGEKQLAAANTVPVEIKNEDVEKSEEEDGSKYVIDTSGEDEFEICDLASLRAHAARLNPNYYGSTSSNFATSTPNSYLHHGHGRKFAHLLNDESKMSPRKNAVSGNSSSSNLSATGGHVREKRKSPTKKTKSPVGATKSRTNLPPMVVIHDQNPAITCAKKLKTLIEEQEHNSAEDMKESINIVARTKDSLKHRKSGNISIESTKSPSNSNKHLTTSSTCVDSDEESKLNEVSTLVDIGPKCSVTSTKSHSKTKEDNKHLTNTNYDMKVTSTKNSKSNWTRDEDKAILIEMKMQTQDRTNLLASIKNQLPERTMAEIESRYLFLIDFLKKLP